MTESNGRLRLSWAQVAWGIATLAAIIGSWADTRTQIATLRVEMALRHERADDDRQRIWKVVEEVRADVRALDDVPPKKGTK